MTKEEKIHHITIAIKAVNYKIGKLILLDDPTGEIAKELDSLRLAGLYLIELAKQ